MTTHSDLKHLLAGISLLILAIGFSLLGLLVLINRPQRDLASGTLLENNGCLIGSIVSIFAGAIFLVAAWVYWSRSLSITATQHHKEQVKPRAGPSRTHDFWWPLTTAPAAASSFKKSRTEANAISPIIRKAR